MLANEHTQHRSLSSHHKQAAILAGATLTGLRLLSANPEIPVPEAGLNLTTNAVFSSPGVLAVHSPSQPAPFNTLVDVRPVIVKNSGGSGTISSIEIFSYLEGLNTNATQLPVPLNLADYASNLVLNVSFFPSLSAFTNAPLGGQAVATRLTEATLSRLEGQSLTNARTSIVGTSTNVLTTVNSNVYRVKIDIPESLGFSVSNGQQYALSVWYHKADETGVPQTTTWLPRIVTSATNDPSFNFLLADKRGTNSPTALRDLGDATGGRAESLAVAVNVQAPAPIAQPTLAIEQTQGTIEIATVAPLASPERWRLEMVTTLGGVPTVIPSSLRSIVDGRAVYQIPKSSLPESLGFFQLVFE